MTTYAHPYCVFVLGSDFSGGREGTHGQKFVVTGRQRKLYPNTMNPLFMGPQIWETGPPLAPPVRPSREFRDDCLCFNFDSLLFRSTASRKTNATTLPAGSSHGGSHGGMGTLGGMSNNPNGGLGGGGGGGGTLASVGGGAGGGSQFAMINGARNPPRPTPSMVNYSDEDDSAKGYDENPDDSDSLTEKPSEISSTDSQVICQIMNFGYTSILISDFDTTFMYVWAI